MVDLGAQLFGKLFVVLVEVLAGGFVDAAIVGGDAKVLGAVALLFNVLNDPLIVLRAQGFDKVAGEGFASVFGLVVVADVGVKSAEV